MKTKNFMNLALAFAVTAGAFSLQSCKKYQDGPMSLKTPEKRIEGSWTVTSYSSASSEGGSGEYYQITTSQLVFDPQKDGGSNVAFFDYSKYEYGIGGTWQWMENKDGITLTFDSILGNQEFSITRLSDKEMMLVDEVGRQVGFSAWEYK